MRKKTAIVQIKLRIRESLRRRLVHQAAKNDTSLNAEIAKRLESSLTVDEERMAFLIDRLEALYGKAWAMMVEIRPALNEATMEQMLVEVATTPGHTRHEPKPTIDRPRGCACTSMCPISRPFSVGPIYDGTDHRSALASH
jgi:hypothetical protein